MDPSSLNVTQLKSELAKRGVKLPTGSRSKAFYVELYKSQIMGNLIQKDSFLGEHDQRDPGTPVATVTPTTPTVRSSSRLKDKKSEVKRDRDDITKQLPFDDEEKPKKKKKSKQIESEEVISIGDQEDNEWRAYIAEPVAPDQQKLDKFVTKEPTPKKTSPPKSTPTPPKQDTLRQTNLFGEVTTSNIILPVDQVVLETPTETGKQLTMEAFPVPRIQPKRGVSLAPLSTQTLDMVSHIRVSSNQERQDRITNEQKKRLEEEEAAKQDASRRKSTPIPQKTRSLVDSKPSRKSNFRGVVAKKVEEEVKTRSNLVWFVIAILSILVFLIGARFVGGSDDGIGSLCGKPFCDTPDATKPLVWSGDSCEECPNNGYCQVGVLSMCDPPSVRSAHFALCVQDSLVANQTQLLTKKILDKVTTPAWFDCEEYTKKSFDLVAVVIAELNITEGVNELVSSFKALLETNSADVGLKLVSEEGTDFITNVYPISNRMCKLYSAFSNVLKYPYELIATAIVLFVLYVLNTIAQQRGNERVEFEAIVSAAITRVKELKSASEPQIQDLIKGEEDFKSTDIEAIWDQVSEAIKQDPRINTKVEGDLKTWEWAPSSDELSKQLF